MTFFAITNANELQWIGEAGSATEAVRLFMNDVGVDSFVEPVVYELPELPEGWQEAGPLGWLCEWVEEHGRRYCDVEDQVRIDGTIYDWSAVTNLMDPEIIVEMTTAGICTEPLDEYVRVYRELHADKFEGEFFTVN